MFLVLLLSLVHFLCTEQAVVLPRFAGFTAASVVRTLGLIRHSWCCVGAVYNSVRTCKDRLCINFATKTVPVNTFPGRMMAVELNIWLFFRPMVRTSENPFHLKIYSTLFSSSLLTTRVRLVGTMSAVSTGGVGVSTVFEQHNSK